MSNPLPAEFTAALAAAVAQAQTDPYGPLELEPCFPGDDYQILHTEDGIPAGSQVTQAWCVIKQFAWDTSPIIGPLAIDATQTVYGRVTDPGSTQQDGSYACTLQFLLPGSLTALLTPGVYYRYAIRLLTDTGAYYTPDAGYFPTQAGGF